ncbi:hypothetical protein HMPREF1551_02249 [Capnocytophaga sp. oral taxon 863 str. F0517]|uniref:hypothetical protein n=1 Tax=Capnocytophaga sp. oral taxon 863 TaxID=1227265 RepID=UPI0003977400|nr:hypothetical protein [Capnocytophaga sp. oral taxon 863]ERI61784.1 hypothetical protein HMPREF1551_02249 [Capnocytophaga sp. oral taxon 863 str. F0517]
MRTVKKKATNIQLKYTPSVGWISILVLQTTLERLLEIGRGKKNMNISKPFL